MSQGAATQDDRGAPWFPSLSRKLAGIAGRGPAFAVALGLVLAWVVTGPLFGFSDAWQLTINTGTTIITFLMVFLIQNTQNRDTEAIQIKLDEIIRATRGAHNALLDMEEASEEELAAYHKRYAELAAYARRKLKEGGSDEDVPVLRDGA
jgi:low affinity Fe/Cu permease